MAARFRSVKRQDFREYFQPSRIVMLVVKDCATDKVNITTLCFAMHASYKPTSVAFALEKRHLSYEFLAVQTRCVLAVPGRDLAKQALLCGTKSGRSMEKDRLSNLRLCHGSSPEFIWIERAMANIEIEIRSRVDSGDHDVFVGKVQSFFVNPAAPGPNLLSIGRNHAGYELLAQSGVHRVGIPMR
jgi:flavin reductase (DIM6/NTAB) family NADH-FMN oxidoreductase RutF